MSDIAIHQLPAASALTGAEIIPLDDGLATVHTTVNTLRAGLATTVHTHVTADVTGLTSALDAKAPTASPTFSGAIIADATLKVRQTANHTAAFGETPQIQVSQLRGQHPAPLALYTWGADNVGPRAILAKSRGTAVGSHATVAVNDELGGLYFCGSNGVTFNDVAASVTASSAATPGGDMPGRLTFATTSVGATAPAERLRIGPDGTVTHRANATVVIDAASHIGLRSYTVATLPNASPAARLIHVSDGSSNRRLAISDGAVWRFPDGATVS